MDLKKIFNETVLWSNYCVKLPNQFFAISKKDNFKNRIAE